MKSYHKLKKIKEVLPDEHIKWKYDSFAKLNIENLLKISMLLDKNEKIFLFSIIPYIHYDTCCLTYRNGKEIGFNNLIEITGISRGKIGTVINTLIEKNIIYKGKYDNKTLFFVNPYIFCRGNKINVGLLEIFKDIE